MYLQSSFGNTEAGADKKQAQDEGPPARARGRTTAHGCTDKAEAGDLRVL